MSKADHALITSAKPAPTRRSVLSTGAQIAGVAAVGALAGAIPAAAELAPPVPTGGSRISPELARARALVLLLTADGKALGPAERAGKLEEAEEEMHRHFSELVDISNHIWAKPVRSWADVTELAEIACFHSSVGSPLENSSYFEGGAIPRRPEDVDPDAGGCCDDAEHAGAVHLIRAVLHMGGARA